VFSLWDPKRNGISSFLRLQWVVDTLEKPIVTMNWLEQCWIEHRVVPHEPYRIIPFTGLNICVTKLNQGKSKSPIDSPPPPINFLFKVSNIVPPMGCNAIKKLHYLALESGRF
jgi:hypothetical protein